MSEPRWTYDNLDSEVLFFGPLPGDCWVSLAEANDGEDSKSDIAYDALVQCVRDADTLRQARELAAEWTDASPDARSELTHEVMWLLTEDPG